MPGRFDWIWVKPLLFSVLSIAAVFGARLADHTGLDLVAITEGYYGKAGLFMLFLMIIAVFGMVILTFVRWVDRITRLGRLGNTIDKVEIDVLLEISSERNTRRMNMDLEDL